MQRIGNFFQAAQFGQKDFLAEMTQRLAQAAVVAAVGLCWLLLPQKEYPYEVLPLMAALGGVNGLALWLINRERIGLARITVAAGDSLVLLAALLVSPLSWLPFIALPLMLANALLINNLAGIGFGVLVGAAVWFLDSAGVRVYSLQGIAAALGTGLVVNWLSVNTLATMVDWYQATQAQSEKLLDETRLHRAELSRALKSLTLANELQRKTQNDLVLARQQADRARQMKEQFAANISHELRTPLNLIIGFSKLMYMSPEVYGKVGWTPELQHDVAQIYRSSRHLMDMIDDILDLSQFEMSGFSLVREPTPMGLFLQDAVETIGNLFRGGPVQFSVKIAADLPVIDIDRTRIRQVLINLLTNAYRYTQSGRVELTAALKEQEVQIKIRDTGPGIAAEKLPFIFEEFFQADASLSRRSGGVGLGLTICKRFVEAHNGRIWVESQLDHGSTFGFSLPCSSGATLPPSEGTQPVTYSNLLPNVLLVDDDPEVFGILRRQIEGYEWIQVPGLGALQPALQQYHPRAVVLNLPGEQLERGDLPEMDVPMFACTLPRRMERSDELASLTLLEKPVDLDTLTRELTRYGLVRDLLVIDDDRGFIQLLERQMTAAGSEVQIRRAYTGQEGLDAMRAQRPDLIFLDLVMPEINGMQVLKQMHADPTLNDIPTCLVTSGSYELETVNRQGQSLLIHHAQGLRPSKVFEYLRVLLNQTEPVSSSIL